jgi:tetratricopeptide (TPR) repeat protein
MENHKISWLWRQVEEARNSGDTEKAIEGLKRLLEDVSVKHTPDENLAVLELSRIKLDRGEIHSAAGMLSNFKWYGVPGAAALLLSADVFLKLDLFETALESLESYLKVYPKDTDASRKKGLVLLMLHRDGDAERVLLSVARRERYRVASTLTYLALLEAKRDRLEESLHLLLQAKELAPYDEKIEHSLLRIEALRVQMRRSAIENTELPLPEVVPGMTAGMLGLHGYSSEVANAAADTWNRFCASNTPSGRKPEAWAAALEYAVTRGGPHFTQEQLAGEYGVSVSQLCDHYHVLKNAVRIPETRLLERLASEGSDLLRDARMEEIAEILADMGSSSNEFESASDAAAWVFERVVPVDEIQRREIEEFVAYTWRKKGYRK